MGWKLVPLFPRFLRKEKDKPFVLRVAQPENSPNNGEGGWATRVDRESEQQRSETTIWVFPKLGKHPKMDGL